MSHVVNGELMHFIGHNGISKVHYFAKDNRLQEIPYDFDGIIYVHEEREKTRKGTGKDRSLEVYSDTHQEWLGNL